MISQNSPYAKYLIYIYTVLISLTILLLYAIAPEWVYRFTWIIVLFFFLLTLGSIHLTKYTAKNWPGQFINIYFGIMTLRLFISVAFALVFIFKDRSQVFLFAITFLVLYLLFLGFEIYTIITNLRTHFKKGIGND